MLTFCDPTAAAVADITAFTPTHTVARYSGTVAELFADVNTGTPDRTVHARPLIGLTTPRTTDGRRGVMCLTLANAATIHHHTDPTGTTGSSPRGYTATTHHAGHLTPGDQWRPLPDQPPRTVTDITVTTASSC